MYRNGINFIQCLSSFFLLADFFGFGWEAFSLPLLPSLWRGFFCSSYFKFKFSINFYYSFSSFYSSNFFWSSILSSYACLYISANSSFSNVLYSVVTNYNNSNLFLGSFSNIDFIISFPNGEIGTPAGNLTLSVRMLLINSFSLLLKNGKKPNTME